MKKHSTFVFDSYSFDREKGVIALKYSLDGEILFTETLTLPIEGLLDIPKETLYSALFALHLMGGTSYYKTCCPKTIEVRSGELTKEQADFWNTVYTKGLGEFFYQNKIDFHGLVNFPISNVTLSPSKGDIAEDGLRRAQPDKVLIPIGGGKDSVVTVESLRESGAEITLLRMGTHPLIDEMVQTMDISCINIKRQLSPSLFRLNEEDALNGHIPITGYLSALTVVIALLYGFDKIAMSNERSANEGNTEYLGEKINHQWSKSEEFEKMFQNYIHDFIDPSLNYKSHLRSMNELEIVEKFVQYPQYFHCTTSCNKNWKIVSKKETDNVWCGKCPKCAFVFCLFAAKLPKEKLIEIFGKNLYEDESLIPLYMKLLGEEGFKPFECVGTSEETKEAFELAHKRGDLDDTPIMQLYLSL
jgi:UDP-N-acetyl-alpha-D-muramoyl-L-alanyl-L-glutamate epimerase